MYFQSMHALLTMEGHGVYVWTAYLVTSLVIVLALLSPLRRSRRLLAQSVRELRQGKNSVGIGDMSEGER